MRFFETFRKLAEALFDTILPPRERTARTKSRTLHDLALSPESHTLLGVRITTLLSYQSPAVRDTIQSLKYDHSPHAAKLCAHALADYLREEIASLRAFSPRPILIAPVPLHPSRARERGFNQIERVLQELPHDFKNGILARIEPRALARTRATPPQTKLSREERLSNVHGAFRASDEIVRSAHIIIIDDVATTGATLAECTHALERSGATVTTLALARA